MKFKSFRARNSAQRSLSGVSPIEAMEDRRLFSATLSLLASLNGTYGIGPRGNLSFDSAGNLVGTATSGGATNSGTLYSYDFNSKSISLLASFDGSNGSTPYGPVVVQGSGNVIGLSGAGGATAYGTFYQYTKADGTITALGTLADVNGSNPVQDGAFPTGGLVLSPDGNYYAAAAGSGANGAGTIDRFSGSGTITPVAQFNNSNGAQPESPLLVDSAGNLFGTTFNGGASGKGVVYELPAHSNTINVLASFTGANGANPFAGLIEDASGNLYGCAEGGGANSQGDVYEVTNGQIIDLADFNGINGSDPRGNLLMDANGNLFGTTRGGGPSGDGTVFEIPASTHVLQTIATFNGTNGSGPQGGLIANSSGEMFGTTDAGGTGNLGTIYKLTLDGSTAGADAPVFSTQPLSTKAGVVLTAFTVSEQTAAGQLDSAATGSITLSLTGGLDGRLSGTLTQPLVNGVATFSDITVGAPGSYTLSANDGTAQVSSAAFAISSSGVVTTSLAGVLPAATVIAGQPVKINEKLVVINPGASGLIGSVRAAQLYLSSTPALDSTAIPLGVPLTKAIKLKAGKSTNLLFHLKALPASTPAGAYYLIARLTDPSGSIVDSGAVGPVQISAPQVELSGSFVSVTPKAKTGKNISVVLSIASDGNVAAIGSLPIQIDLSTSGADDQNISLAPQVKRINLKPGKRTKVALHVPLTGIAAGSYQVFIKLDPANTFNDLNTADNVFNSIPGVLTVTG